MALEAQQVPNLLRVSHASDGGLGVLQQRLNDAGAGRVATILIAGMANRYGRCPVSEIVGGGRGPVPDAETLLVHGIRITRE